MTQSSKTDTAQIKHGHHPNGYGRCDCKGSVNEHYEALYADRDPFQVRHPALVPVSPEVAALTSHYAALVDLEDAAHKYGSVNAAAALTWALGRLEDAIQDEEDKARRRADQPRCADCGSPGAHLVDCTSVHPALAREGLFSLSNAVDAPEARPYYEVLATHGLMPIPVPYTYAPDCLVCGADDIEHADENCWSCDAVLPVSPAPFADDPVTGITDASSARAEKASWRPAGPIQGQTLADMQAEMDNIMNQVVGNLDKMDDLGRKVFPAPSGYDALLSALKTEGAGIDLDEVKP